MSDKERNDLNDLKPSRQESNNTAAAAALSVQDLAVYYPAGHRKFVHAVDGVSFQLYPGETLGLVGESGCGKTTLGRAILGLTPVTRGTILFEGRDISTFKSEALKEHRRHIQIVFQDPYSSLDPLMTIEQILSEPLKIHHLCSGRKERSEKIAGLLRAVGLDPELAKRYPHEFSGGQRQRIGIARALSLNPRMIVCDEPVSALDVSIQAQVINLLMDIQEAQGISYLFISHDLAVVQHICHRIAVMYLGQIVEQGTTEDIHSRPLHPYTKALLDAVPSLEKNSGAKKIFLSGEIPSPLDPPAGCRFHPRCPFATERCRREAPAPVEITPGHTVTCHLCSSDTTPSL